MKLSPVTLQGNVIQLVPMSHAHLDGLCEIGLEPRLWQATTIQVTTRDEMRAYIAAALEGQAAATVLPFVIVRKDTGRIIGSTRFHSFVPEHRRVEIGFSWIGLEWQRTGANTEAKYLMLQHAFDTLGCIRVEFRADSRNEQSRRALLRVGATLEGILRSHRISVVRGVCDIVVFSIIAAEWPAVRERLREKLKSGD